MRGSARLPLVAGFFNDLLDFCFLAFGSPTGRTSLTSQKTESPTSRTSRTSQRTKAEHSPLWGSTYFSLSLSHESYKILHERERATHPAFLRSDTIRLSADSLIASADRIRKPANTIRKLAGRIRPQTSRKMRKSAVFEVKNQKNSKISPKTILQNPPTKKNFGRSTLFSR